DYAANAAAKALAAARASGLPALGDDSGLEVEALGGAPGPRSARFGGPGLDDAGRTRALLAALDGVPAERRGARFVCVAALATPDGVVATARGECPGRIATEPRGSAGFGYDPIFETAPGGPTMAELPEAEKERISHRGRAFRALGPSLRALPG
ncbi:MAG TPA: non-canonical purine NTP pyrophosphatase, partial [Myxococcota bacterium]|nr:non-canonical purine NTP pyrophosphatase [Myxococcota bacterium]